MLESMPPFHEDWNSSRLFGAKKDFRCSISSFATLRETVKILLLNRPNPCSNGRSKLLKLLSLINNGFNISRVTSE